MDVSFIQENDLWENWGVIQKPSGDLFDHQDIKDKPIHHVWTILESGNDEDGNWYASPGIHYVNRLGYILTRKPWTDFCRDAIYFLDDFQNENRDRG